MQILLLYRLRPGVSIERYRAWSLERDQRVTPARVGIESFRVFELSSPDGSGDFAVAELIEVADWETWQRIASSGPNVAIGREFGELAEVDSVVSLAATPIVPAV